MHSSPIANRQGQPLAAHSVLVGLVARELVLRTYPFSQDPDNGPRYRETLAEDAFVAGLAHDIGKLDPNMQRYLQAMHQLGQAEEPEGAEAQIDVAEDAVGPLKKAQAPFKKFSFEVYPRHEEVSWLLLEQYFQEHVLRESLFSKEANDRFSRRSSVAHAVYWHHAKPLRSKATKDGDTFSTLKGLAILMAPAGADDSWLGSPQVEADLRALLTEMQDLLAGDPLQRFATGMADSLCDPGHPQDWPSANGKTPAFKSEFLDASQVQPGAPLEKSLLIEMRRTIVRSCLVGADRLVSTLSRDTALQWLEYYRGKGSVSGLLEPLDSSAAEPLYAQIRGMEEAFEARYPGTRTEEQGQAAQDLAKVALRQKVACLQGPAGCGKSKIALQFLARVSDAEQQQPRRTFFLVPRTAIGESLYQEMVTDYGVTADVELLTGARKQMCRAGQPPRDTLPEEEGTGALVVTTIDQIARTLLSHQKIDLMTQLANSHVVIDEVHELFELPGIVLLFLELMRLRKTSHGSTLLVSATPNPYMLQQLGVKPSAIVSVASFNQKPFTLTLQELEPGTYGTSKTEPHLFANPSKFTPEDNSFVVCNTATLAQAAAAAHYIKGTSPAGEGIAQGRPVLCFHSKFTPVDKSSMLKRVISLFGTSPTARNELLVSGPIVQASLNVSTANLYTEATHLENLLQRCGRLNRFGRLDTSHMRICWERGNLDAKTREPTLANKQTLTRVHQTRRATAAIYWLYAKVKEAGTSDAGSASAELTLAQLYAWYAEFHSTPEALAAYAEDFGAVLKASAAVFQNNDFDPVQIPVFMRTAKKKGGRLMKASLRGRSYFVLPLRLTIPVDGVSPVRKELLWNNTSPETHLMTDALEVASRSDEGGLKFLKWTTNAGKPGGFPKSLLASEPLAASFLDDIAKATRHVKKWTALRAMALSRERPVLSAPTFDDEGVFYCELTRPQAASLNLGLMGGKAAAQFPQLNIKARLA